MTPAPRPASAGTSPGPTAPAGGGITAEAAAGREIGRGQEADMSIADQWTCFEPARAPICRICEARAPWKGDVCELCRSIAAPPPENCHHRCQECTALFICIEDRSHAD